MIQYRLPQGLVLAAALTLGTSTTFAQSTPPSTAPASILTTAPIPAAFPLPKLAAFTPLPSPDPQFQEQITKLVRDNQLDTTTPADQNADKTDVSGSVCVVDFSSGKPRVGGWQMGNFVYPASTYKMYVLGEAIRQVCEGELSLDQPTTVSKNNYRGGTDIGADKVVPLAEILRLMCTYSDNTAANVSIDTINRKRATALLHALGCSGSEITRKYLPRSREDAEFTSAPGTMSSAFHFATFLWAVEQGTIGGGRGRGLIKGFLAGNVQNATRFRAGLPPSATIYSKTGEWDSWTAEAAIVEDGPLKYIVVVMAVQPVKEAGPRMAAFVRGVHELLCKKGKE